MVRIKPFAAVRPPKQYAEEVAARPYDVLNSVEAKAEAGEKSLLHITKPEIDFDPIIDEHTQPAYDKAVENFSSWQSKGWLVQDEKSCYYVYAQAMEGRTQYGLVVCAHTDDYAEGHLAAHEPSHAHQAAFYCPPRRLLRAQQGRFRPGGGNLRRYPHGGYGQVLRRRKLP